MDGAESMGFVNKKKGGRGTSPPTEDESLKKRGGGKRVRRTGENSGTKLTLILSEARRGKQFPRTPTQPTRGERMLRRKVQREFLGGG